MKARTTVWARANLKMLTVNGRMSFSTMKINAFDLSHPIRLPNYWINKVNFTLVRSNEFFWYRFRTAHAWERELP